MSNTKLNYNPFTTWTFWAITSVTGSLILTKLDLFGGRSSSYLWTSFKYTAAFLFLLQWLTYSVYTIVIYPRFVSPLRNLPEPDGNAFFSGQWSKITKEPSGIPMRRWINEIPNNGLIRYRHLFNRDRLLVVSPKALAEVMVTKSYDFVKPDFIASGIGRILGIGILFAEGDEHKKQRKALSPAFNFRHIKQLYPIFWNKSVEMVDAIISQSLNKEGAGSDLASAASIEIGEWASRATLDIIGVAGLGQDFDSIANPDTELNKVYRSIFQPSRTGQILALLQFFIPAWIVQRLPIKRNDDVHAASRVARDTSRQLIEKKKKAQAAKQDLPPDIISVALESGGFSDEDLVNNMMTFLAAGHETTASSMTWALYLMCQHPEAQKRLREEVRQHIQDPHATEINSNVIDNMPYLNALCNETLRMWSPVPLTLRDTVADTTILGQFVPKGTKVILCPWAVNYSKELWGDDALEFKPERWLAAGQANAGGASSNYSFLTFLHGPRSCIGEKFARAEMACLLAAFVGKFEFDFKNPADGEHVDIKGGITARPREGLWLKVREVGGW